jgi:hypothetical protein
MHTALIWIFSSIIPYFCTKATTELVSCNWLFLLHLVLLWVNQNFTHFSEYRAVFEFHIGATKATRSRPYRLKCIREWYPALPTPVNIKIGWTLRFRFKNVQSISQFERTDVRNTKTITYDTISTTTSSNMHESHTVAILNNIPVD